MKRSIGIARCAWPSCRRSPLGKGLDLSLRADRGSQRVGEQVEISLEGVADEAATQPCRRMRVVVVAPGVSVKRALRSLELEVRPAAR